MKEKGFDPRKLLAPGAEAIKDMVITKIKLLDLKEKLTNKICHFLTKLNIDDVNIDKVRTPQRMLWSSLLIFSFIRRDVDFVDFFSC